MNLAQLTTMLELQSRLNAVVNPEWVTAKYPWHRAIMVEAVEALEHYGWKWWKAAPEPDVDQIRLELVDIWHFALSMVLEYKEGDIESAAANVADYISRVEADPNAFGEVTSLGVPELFDKIVGSAGFAQQLNVGAFYQLMPRFGLSWDELYTMYIAKNVLNLFRQANGYKQGTYQKDWNGMEDNAALMTILHANPLATPDQLMVMLDSIYKETAL